MPRRKQDLPKKHDSGTNSIGDQNEHGVMPNDQQDVDLSLECGKTPTSSMKYEQMNQKEAVEEASGKTDSALDLSTRKRRSSTSSEDTSPTIKKCPSLTLSDPKAEKISFSSIQPLFGLNMGGLSAMSSMYIPSLQFPFPSTLPSAMPPSQNGGTANTDALSKLSSLVHQVGKCQRSNQVTADTTASSKTTSSDQISTDSENKGNLHEALNAAAGHGLSFQELWLRFVKKEENAELKRLNEAKQIFTCLQCHASFQTMEQLVKHMETTQHYANIPKHYSWSLQYARQRMRQMKMKMKYSDKMMYYCFLCTAPFSEPVHIHFNCVHNMHNPVENMKFVHVISVNGKNVNRTPSSISSLPTGKRRNGAVSLTSPSSNGEQRHRSRSNEDDFRLSSSPLSIEASSCDSDSISPTPSSSSKRSTNLASNFSSPVMVPNQVDCIASIDTTNMPTDNLLSKMEKLVESASSETCDRKPRVHLVAHDMGLNSKV